MGSWDDREASDLGPNRMELQSGGQTRTRDLHIRANWGWRIVLWFLIGRALSRSRWWHSSGWVIGPVIICQIMHQISQNAIPICKCHLVWRIWLIGRSMQPGILSNQNSWTQMRPKSHIQILWMTRIGILKGVMSSNQVKQIRLLICEQCVTRTICICGSPRVLHVSFAHFSIRFHLAGQIHRICWFYQLTIHAFAEPFQTVGVQRNDANDHTGPRSFWIKSDWFCLGHRSIHA